MRFKLLGASLFVAVAITITLNGWHAQAQEARDKSKTKKSAAATTAAEGAAKAAAENSAEPSEWSLAVPMPVIAPIVMPDIVIPEIVLPEISIPDINLDLSDMYIETPGDWFYSDDGERTEREELRQTYQLSPGARVELSHINGSIDIETIEGSTAELRITSSSYNPNPRKLAVEQTASSLAVRGTARGKGNGDGMNFDNTSHRVWLKLPRRVELTVEGASGSVHIGELDGSIRLSNVSGSVGVAQAAGSALVSGVSGSVTLKMARVGAGGVRVENVSGKVNLRFMDDVNADLQTRGIKGKVYVELANVAVEGEMNRADFRARVGTGGAPIHISDVTGSVRLARGRTVAEMLGALKSAERSAARMETARDLTLHVSNRQVRQAFIEVLAGGEGNNSVVQMTASRALMPYAGESDVRAAFMRAIESGKNEMVRTNAVRAVAKNYAGDKAVRDVLLRVFATEQKDIVRMTIIGAVAKYADDREVQRTLAGALKNDRSDIVRMRAAGALSKRVEQPEVYELLLNAARGDKKMIVRANALDGLRSRIKDRPELRELFTGYLEHESHLLQYKALHGLVELGDPALKTRLVEKAKELIEMQSHRQWNDRMLLDTLLLLRRLDAGEADRVLEQLGSERMKSY